MFWRRSENVFGRHKIKHLGYVLYNVYITFYPDVFCWTFIKRFLYVQIKQIKTHFFNKYQAITIDTRRKLRIDRGAVVAERIRRRTSIPKSVGTVILSIEFDPRIRFQKKVNTIHHWFSILSSTKQVHEYSYEYSWSCKCYPVLRYSCTFWVIMLICLYK